MLTLHVQPNLALSACKSKPPLGFKGKGKTLHALRSTREANTLTGICLVPNTLRTFFFKKREITIKSETHT